MAENKTQPSKASVAQFLNAIDNDRRRSDAKAVAAMMRKATGKRARLWGREGDWALVGFSPRKQNLAIYIIPGFAQFDALMKRLGKYKTGKSCLYINKLDDVDEDVLQQLIERSVELMALQFTS